MKNIKKEAPVGLLIGKKGIRGTWKKMYRHIDTHTAV